MVSLMSQEIEIQALYPKSISSLRSRQSQLIKKREILLDGSEDLILSLYTKGMSVRDIQLHLDDLYGYELSTQTLQTKLLKKQMSGGVVLLIKYIQSSLWMQLY